MKLSCTAELGTVIAQSVLTSVAKAMTSLVSYYGPLLSSSAWILILRAHVLDFGHELSSKISIKTRPEHLRSVNPLSSNPHPIGASSTVAYENTDGLSRPRSGEANTQS